MSILSTLSKTVDNAQKLKELHQYIEQRDLPIQSRDEYPAQIIEIEAYLGTQQYRDFLKKKNTVNYLSGILALPALIFALFLFADRILSKWAIDLKVAEVSQKLLNFAIENSALMIIYALIFIATIIYFYALNRKTEQYEEQVITAFLARTQR
ncbi:DUF6097 family protein [Acinetobacter larvae]|uniref:Uncharacterized protein n=1 Tax=Acinetobacter larvae TaxID=1789224 RepID=A0A1B2M1N9_9GAMM|nr:DUF6097 family protein [Acinetobacter larvae]AOA58933.1 hypothetical protein BFG52_11605 [Acinetobacter larvae]